MAPLFLAAGLGLAPRARRTAAGPAAPVRREAFRVALYGDSYGQWAQNFTTNPNDTDSGLADPQAKKMPVEASLDVGGHIDGYAALLNILSGGKYALDWRSNNAVGGLNSGQLERLTEDTVNSGEWLTWVKGRLAARIAAGRGPDVIVLPVGTNDGVTDFEVTKSFNSVVKIATHLLGLSPTLKVVLELFGPRGGSEFTSARLTPAQNTLHKQRFDKLKADFAAALPAGRAAVCDGWTGYEDTTTGVAGDILPGLTLDGLHRSPAFGQLQVPRLVAAMDSLFPGPISGFLGQADNLLPSGSGTGGTVARGGGATSTTGFTASGQCWTGWSLQGSGGWIGTGGNNVTGTLVGTVDGQGRQVIDVNGNASGKTSKGAVTVRLTRAVPLAGLVEGDWIEAIASLELSGLAGFRGVDLELACVEPDGVTRTQYILKPTAIINRANLEWTPNDYAGANKLVVRSHPRLVKAGTYGSITLNLMLHFAGQAASVRALAKVDPTVTLRKIG